LSLRKRVFWTIISLLLIVFIATLLVSRYFLIDNDIKLERQIEELDVNRVEAVLQYRIDALAGYIADWAYWDDTYQFVQDRNQQYIDSNLAPATTFTVFQIDAIAFTNTNGGIVYSCAYDWRTNHNVPVHQNFLDSITQGDLAAFATGQESAAGVVMLGKTPAIVACCPILPSAGTGPARGSVIMIRYVDDVEAAVLSKTSQTTVSILGLDNNSTPGAADALKQLQPDPSAIYLKTNGADSISAYNLINDVKGKPALLMQVETPRYGYSLAQRGIVVVVLLLAGSAILSAVIALLFINTQIISRVTGLRKSLNNITRSADNSGRVPVKGNDEIASLSEDINGMLTTIEQNREAEKSLNKSLEKEIKLRSEYANELVHELKTPITPILSSSEMLVEGMKQEPWARLSRSIYRGALDMNDRLNDLLDNARSEVGTLKLRNEPVDMLELLREMSEEMSPLIANRGQHLVVDLPESLPIVKGDHVRLRQVLRNLLSNATKYTPEKGIIKVSALSADKRLIVSIEDTGRGIPPEQLARIFEPYVKITEGVLDRQTGLGLGLKLSKTLVELHGGTIWVESVKGKGSKFSFSLPAEMN